MTHRFPVKEIALQAAVSTATVDRVLNGRLHVSHQMRRRVSDAIKELEAQDGQLAARGRKLFVDIVVEAPTRFSREIRRATEALLPQYSRAVFRPRFTFQEVMNAAHVVKILNNIAARGTNGILLKARNEPSIRAAIDKLATKNVPVATIFTDIPTKSRVGYAGPDHFHAGQLAAYLLCKTRVPPDGCILTSTSQSSFEGEALRLAGFREYMLRNAGGPEIIMVTGGGGIGHFTETHVLEILGAVRKLSGVYSMGGGNRAIISALERLELKPDIFIAHDLDIDNVSLLKQKKLDFVLHHDMMNDVKQAFDMIAFAHRLLPVAPATTLSKAQIYTQIDVAP